MSMRTLRCDGRGKYVVIGTLGNGSIGETGEVVDPYSGHNQLVLSRLASEYVIANVTDLVDDLTKSFHKDWNLLDFANYAEDEDGNWPEIMEWYIVDSVLGEYLMDKGEIVCERRSGWLWGRQGFGQSVWIDEVVMTFLTKIALRRDELEFEGQQDNESEAN